VLGKTKGKMGTIMDVLISLAVIITMGIYISVARFDIGSMSTIFILLILVGLATFVVTGRAKSIKRGLPAQDEMSKRMMQKAGYYTWLVTIYLALGIPYVSEMIGIEVIGRHVSAIIISGSALLFFGFYFWFSRRGDA